jgi:hypothetical protein
MEPSEQRQTLGGGRFYSPFQSQLRPTRFAPNPDAVNKISDNLQTEHTAANAEFDRLRLARDNMISQAHELYKPEVESAFQRFDPESILSNTGDLPLGTQHRLRNLARRSATEMLPIQQQVEERQRRLQFVQQGLTAGNITEQDADYILNYEPTANQGRYSVNGLISNSPNLDALIGETLRIQHEQNNTHRSADGTTETTVILSEDRIKSNTMGILRNNPEVISYLTRLYNRQVQLSGQPPTEEGLQAFITEQLTNKVEAYARARAVDNRSVLVPAPTGSGGVGGVGDVIPTDIDMTGSQYPTLSFVSSDPSNDRNLGTILDTYTTSSQSDRNMLTSHIDYLLDRYPDNSSVFALPNSRSLIKEMVLGSVNTSIPPGYASVLNRIANNIKEQLRLQGVAVHRYRPIGALDSVRNNEVLTTLRNIAADGSSIYNPQNIPTGEIEAIMGFTHNGGIVVRYKGRRADDSPNINGESNVNIDRSGILKVNNPDAYAGLISRLGIALPAAEVNVSIHNLRFPVTNNIGNTWSRAMSGEADAQTVRMRKVNNQYEISNNGSAPITVSSAIDRVLDSNFNPNSRTTALSFLNQVVQNHNFSNSELKDSILASIGRLANGQNISDQEIRAIRTETANINLRFGTPEHANYTYGLLYANSR